MAGQHLGAVLLSGRRVAVDLSGAVNVPELRDRIAAAEGVPCGRLVQLLLDGRLVENSERVGDLEAAAAELEVVIVKNWLHDFLARTASLTAEFKKWSSGSQELKRTRTALLKEKNRVSHFSESELDRAIKEIEDCLAMNTVSLRDERVYVAEVQKLMRQRPKVRALQERTDRLFLDEMACRDRFMCIMEALDRCVMEVIEQHEDFEPEIRQEMRASFPGVSFRGAVGSDCSSDCWFDDEFEEPNSDDEDRGAAEHDCRKAARAKEYHRERTARAARRPRRGPRPAGSG